MGFILEMFNLKLLGAQIFSSTDVVLVIEQRRDGGGLFFL